MRRLYTGDQSVILKKKLAQVTKLLSKSHQVNVNSRDYRKRSIAMNKTIITACSKLNLAVSFARAFLCASSRVDERSRWLCCSDHLARPSQIRDALSHQSNTRRSREWERRSALGCGHCVRPRFDRCAESSTPVPGRDGGLRARGLVASVAVDLITLCCDAPTIYEHTTESTSHAALSSW